MSGTPRLGLPFISPGQAQKELMHNEALQTLDMVVAGAVDQPPLASPPTGPVEGACYIVGAGATGEWAGHDNALAIFSSGGWKFLAAREGMSVFVSSMSVWAAFRAGTWELGTLRGSSVLIDGQQVVGARAVAIADPSGGSTTDAEARSAIAGILAALRQHGLIEM